MNMKLDQTILAVSILFGLILWMGCNKKQENRDTEIHELNFATFELPDAQTFKVYRKMYGTPPISKNEIIIYLNTWLSGERRFILNNESTLVTNSLGKTLGQNSAVHNPDSLETGWLSRPANENDSLPPLSFKTYSLNGTSSIYKTLLSFGIDTMKSPRIEPWDIHENRFYIIESYIKGQINIFQFSLIDVEGDHRYKWIDSIFMPMDPGQSERAGMKGID